MVSNTWPPPQPPSSTHSLVTLRCEPCGRRWQRDQWTGLPLNVELEEVEHALRDTCNGRVVVDSVHEVSRRPPPPPPPPPRKLPQPDPRLAGNPIRK